MYTKIDQLKFKQKQTMFLDTLPMELKADVEIITLDQLHELIQRFVEKIKQDTQELKVKKIERDKDQCAQELQIFKLASSHLLDTSFYWYHNESHRIGPLLLKLHSFWKYDTCMLSKDEQINLLSTDFTVGFCIHREEYSYSVITWGICT